MHRGSCVRYRHRAPQWQSRIRACTHRPAIDTAYGHCQGAASFATICAEAGRALVAEEFQPPWLSRRSSNETAGRLRGRFEGMPILRGRYGSLLMRNARAWGDATPRTRQATHAVLAAYGRPLRAPETFGDRSVGTT